LIELREMPVACMDSRLFDALTSIRTDRSDAPFMINLIVWIAIVVAIVYKLRPSALP